MRHPLSLLPALLAVAATVVGLPGGAPAATAASAPPASAGEHGGPLEVSIEALTPSSIPARGRVRMRGTVTNASDERWRAINVHAFVSAVPLTTAPEVAEAVQAPVDADVGARITTPGTFDSVGSLDPGESTTFTVTLRRDQLPVSEPGVYWFGAHALGNTDDVRDGVADGRARTFLPLVPTTGRPVEAALVLPLRRSVRHLPSGRVRGVARWADDLAAGGRLDVMVEVAEAADAPLTWLVDPAVPDAAARLVAGNPPRSLADTIQPEAPDEEPEESPDPDEEPTGSGTAEPVDGDVQPVEPVEPVEGDETAETAASWLDRLRGELARGDVLALPYGDLDLAAAAQHDPATYGRARRSSGGVLGRWDLLTSPGAGATSGYASPDELTLLDGDETVVLADHALPPERRPLAAARVGGRRVLFASSATAAGGPGPEPRLGDIALRQRILADAAVRLLSHDREPLVVALPLRFRPTSPTRFWTGLQPGWLDLVPLGQLREGPTLAADELLYPEEEEQRVLDEGAFDAAAALVEAGRTLEALLSNNDQLGDQVLDEALTSLSVTHRGQPLQARADVNRATAWIRARLDAVRITAPKGVTLSSASGSFAATVTNRLPHRVTVSVSAEGQGDVSVAAPAPLELAPRGRQTIVLEATAASPGVHYVQLRVTDGEGTPLGVGQRVPIRSAQVSEAIWLVLGVGVGLLFLAIAVRVVRRVRSERA